jgi:hypothetical protein
MAHKDARVTLRIPRAWVDEANALAEAMSQDGIIITQSDVLRAAIYQGLAVLRKPRRRPPS